MRRHHAFTLIELLIVVAIIAILAAIAVPNFLEAQVRAKVSSVKNDMRSIATALEAYRVDESKYPMDAQWYLATGRLPVPDYLTHLWRLTTPVAFMTSIPYDRFDNRWNILSWAQGDVHRKYYDYRTDYGWVVLNTTVWSDPIAVKYKDKIKYQWVLSSPGPDQRINNGEYLIFGEMALYDIHSGGTWGDNGDGCLYDPTNGTMSAGDVARAGP